MSMTSNTRTRAFTLLEVLVVIAIIVILAGVLGGVLISMANRAKNEGAANQIKKVFAALEQFKQDFGEYPTVDAWNSTGSGTGTALSGVEAEDWAEHNTLAYRLCQNGGFGTGVIATQGILRADRQTWCGSYLTSEDFPVSQIIKADTPTSTTNKDQLLDMWGKPLAYCMAPAAFFAASASSIISTVTQATLESWSKETSLKTGTFTGAHTTIANTVAYKVGRTVYARPYSSSTSINGFMGPVSYALKGTWIDAEMNLPEIWSPGSDGLAIKHQYNSSSTKRKKGTAGDSYNVYNATDTATDYFDKDNVGGNLNVMKIQ